MVRIAALALLAFSAVASARPLSRRNIARDEIVPLLMGRGLSDSEVMLPRLTVRELRDIIDSVKRDDCTTATSTSTSSTSTSTSSTSSSASGFVELQYSQFQISSGVAGQAQEEANAILAAFDGVDKATISDADQTSIENMREAAESAETDLFNPQIAAASGDTATELQTGKIKNKVLKLTLEVFGLEIKLAKAQAAGDSTSSIQSSLDEENTKLSNNIATDQASAGDPSLAATEN